MLKKKILAVVLAVFMAFSLVGCNTQGIAYLQEFKKISKWDAMEVKGDMTIDVGLLGQKVTLLMDYTAYSNQKDTQMEMTLNIKDIKLPEGTEGMFPQPLKFSPIKMYMDGMKMYISTSYIKDLCAMTGENPATLGIDVSKQYIALDMTSMMEEMDMSATDMAAMTEESFKMLEGLKIDVPMTQKGRTYTVTLNDEQMVKLFVDYVLAFSEIAYTPEQLKAMGISEADMKAALAEVEASYKQMGEEMKVALKGSTASLTSTFTNSSYKETMKLNIQANVDGLPLTVGINLVQDGKKVAKKKIAFPTDVKMYTAEDLMGAAVQVQP
ncbi:MAG: hypothetical protein ACRCWY_10045 [Cellulosilyticaceae bacterium]